MWRKDEPFHMQISDETLDVLRNAVVKSDPYKNFLKSIDDTIKEKFKDEAKMLIDTLIKNEDRFFVPEENFKDYSFEITF
jgi:hypothetical protein